MFSPYTFAAVFTFCIYAVLFRRVFRLFLKSGELLMVFLLPLLTFILGFLLRLSSNQAVIDLGFFLTETSSFFLTLLFTLALVLGQVKYWEKEQSKFW